MSGLSKKSTAIQVIHKFGDGAYLKGKIALVTGGNSGIGTETVKALASAGCRVLLCSRSIKNGEEAIASMESGGSYQISDVSNIVVKQLDLNDLDSVRRLGEDVAATETHIDFVVFNAGIMALPTRELTKYKFEGQMAINHFGHFYLFKCLLPLLERQKEKSRVVVVSSALHSRGHIVLDDLHWNNRTYNSWGSYSQTKLANVLFAKEIADQYLGKNINAVSLHPGIIATNLGRHQTMGPCMNWVYHNIICDRNGEQGAATTVYGCLTEEVDEEGKRGSYLSDCKVATPCVEGQDKSGALRKALWKVTEEQLAEGLKL